MAVLTLAGVTSDPFLSKCQDWKLRKGKHYWNKRQVGGTGRETSLRSHFLSSTHFTSFLMGLLFTTWNISGCHSFGPISVYSSLYQLLIWLHKTPSKRRQESIISRELCKRSLSFHNLETTGNPLTLYLSTVLLWSSSTGTEDCWCLT